MNKILLEISCGSLDDAIEAEQGGADRVELCSSLFVGGLTPSLGAIVEAKARLKIPVMVMVRSREGGFCYTDADFAVMERDTRLAIQYGADGIVFGILTSGGTVDLERCKRLRELIGDRQAVFHRAFDVTPDPFAALEQVIALGITRVLTSGQKNSAAEALPLIKQLIDRSSGRIQVMPGGGIRLHNLQNVIRQTGCTQVHLSASQAHYDNSALGRSAIVFGRNQVPPENQYKMTDRTMVAQVAKELRSIEKNG